PYFALVYVHAKKRTKPVDANAPPLAARLLGSVPIYLAALWSIAFAEEWLWDRGVWHDRAWLFGEGWELGAAKLVIVPLLALPQLTHYVLDGFIWKRSAFRDRLAYGPAVAEIS
ncbi:MAG TPA: hypothetical protein VIF62_13665, partial [Labilithrix sp.]